MRLMVNTTEQTKSCYQPQVKDNKKKITGSLVFYKSLIT